MESEHVTAIRFGWYTFVFTLGAIGNIYIVCAIFLTRGMNSPIKVFIANLAISDLGILLICLPAHMTIEFFSWPFGKYACQFLLPLNDVFFAVSILTMTLISWERYRAIVTPFKKRPSGRVAKVVITVTWIVAVLAVGFPLSFITKMTAYIDPVTGNKKILCGPSWETTFERRMHIGFIVVCIVVPLILTAFGYSRIIWVMRKTSSRILERASHVTIPLVALRADSHRGSSDSSYRQDLYQLSITKTMIKMVVIITAVFWISMLPLPVFALIMDFEKLDPKQPEIDALYCSFIALFFTNSAFNPIAIYYLSSDMRQVTYRGCLRLRDREPASE